MPIPSSVMMAEVAGSTLNSSAANLSTAVKGVASGTLSLYFHAIKIKEKGYIQKKLFRYTSNDVFKVLLELIISYKEREGRPQLQTQWGKIARGGSNGLGFPLNIRYF